jgi:hypothetical protein
MSVILEVSLDNPELATKNLGGALSMYSEQMSQVGPIRASVQICNENWYGSYIVPNAMGFVTPIRLLKGAKLVLSRSSNNENNVFKELETFLNIYSEDALIKNIAPKPYSSSFTTCSICLENYTNDDKVLTLQCDHMFHFVCITDYVVTKCDVAGCNNFTTHMRHGAWTFTSTKQATCPLCDSVINF